MPRGTVRGPSLPAKTEETAYGPRNSETECKSLQPKYTWNQCLWHDVLFYGILVWCVVVRYSMYSTITRTTTQFVTTQSGPVWLLENVHAPPVFLSSDTRWSNLLKLRPALEQLNFGKFLTFIVCFIDTPQVPQYFLTLV